MVNYDEIKKLIYGSTLWLKPSRREMIDVIELLNPDDIEKIYKTYKDRFLKGNYIIRGYGSSPLIEQLDADKKMVLIVTRGSYIRLINNKEIYIWSATRWIDIHKKLNDSGYIIPILPLFTPYESLGGLLASHAYLKLFSGRYIDDHIKLYLYDVKSNKKIYKSISNYDNELILYAIFRLSDVLLKHYYIQFYINNISKLHEYYEIYKMLLQNALCPVIYTLLINKNKKSLFVVIYSSNYKVDVVKEVLGDIIKDLGYKIVFTDVNKYVEEIFSYYKEYLIRKCVDNISLKLNKYMTITSLFDTLINHYNERFIGIIDFVNKIILHYQLAGCHERR